LKGTAMPDPIGFPQLFALMAIVLLIWWSARNRSGPRNWF
jgi:hypothetical protein